MRPKLTRDDEVDMGDITISGSSDISEDKDIKSNKTDSNSASLPHTNSLDRKRSRHGQNRLRQSFRKLLGRKQKDDSSTTGYKHYCKKNLMQVLIHEI